MKEARLLDCTLRDGGYLNDWKFGHDNIISIFERLVDAGVEFIEIGFINEKRQYDPDRSIFPDTASIGRTFHGIDRKNALVFGMIDYGTCDISHIQPCAESWLDGIRVIFKEHLREPAMAYIRQLKELGYIVTAQLVSVTTYTEETMMDLVRLANDVRPYAVSMVDTYGLMHQNNLKFYYEILDRYLEPDIAVGYHGHNNFQMGYANCIEMLSFSEKTNRTLLVDGTLYGMGKSAGNAPLELVAMHMNHKYAKSYDISQMLEAIDASVRHFNCQPVWGYSLFYYISALHECHPNYVEYLMSTRSLSVKQIGEILDRLQGKKKLLYDRRYIEEIYRDYLTYDICDEADLSRLRAAFQGRKLLLLGPGPSAVRETETIKDFAAVENPLVITINYMSDSIPADYIFLSNSKRYVQLATKLNQSGVGIIATSNVTSVGKPFAYRVDITKLMDRNAEFVDNSLMMCVKLLVHIGVAEVSLAGFDGYSGTQSNYFDSTKEYDFARKQADYFNRYISDFLASVSDRIHVKFLTSTRYQVPEFRKTDGENL